MHAARAQDVVQAVNGGPLGRVDEKLVAAVRAIFFLASESILALSRRQFSRSWSPKGYLRPGPRAMAIRLALSRLKGSPREVWIFMFLVFCRLSRPHCRDDPTCFLDRRSSTLLDCRFLRSLASKLSDHSPRTCID